MLKVLLIGKSNTGKSTFFNRFANDKSIVLDDTCTTRDIKYSFATFGDCNFLLGDSCGIDLEKNNTLCEQVIRINQQSILESDLVLFMLDNRVLQNIDFDFIKFIASNNKQCIILINKIELISSIDSSHFKFAKNYLMLEISAKHKTGFKEFYSHFSQFISKSETNLYFNESQQDYIKIAICGRPNVGKSSFINSILGSERLLTSKIEGTTSDSVKIDLQYKNHNLRIYDTSGLKRKILLTKKNAAKSLGYLAAHETFKIIKKSDITILIVDAIEQLILQDLKITNYVLDHNKSLIIVVNKLDLIPKIQRTFFCKSFKNLLRFKFPQTKYIHIYFISVKNKEKLYEPLKCAVEIFSKFKLKIPTSLINKWIREKINYYPLPFTQSFGKKVKIKYLTQISDFPLKFKVFVNFPELISNSYKKYLINSLANDFALKSLPIDMIFVKSPNPYIR